MGLTTFEYGKSLTELINDVTLKHVTIDWFTVAVNYSCLIDKKYICFPSQCLKEDHVFPWKLEVNSGTCLCFAAVQMTI